MAIRVTHALQSTAVAIGGRAILIQGATGSGKSSLALALIDRGAVLIGDDGVMLEASDAKLVVRPHPNTRGLIEVRNLGLLTFPVCNEAPVSLVVRLAAGAPRYIESPDQIVLHGVSAPLLVIDPSGPNLAIKAELALGKFGNARS